MGTAALGYEILSLSSIVFLGKEGFKAIKAEADAFVKTSYTGPVGPRRHYIGIALFLTNVVTAYIVAFYLWDAFGASTAPAPPLKIWGLDLKQQENF